MSAPSSHSSDASIVSSEDEKKKADLSHSAVSDLVSSNEHKDGLLLKETTPLLAPAPPIETSPLSTSILSVETPTIVPETQPVDTVALPSPSSTTQTASSTSPPTSNIAGETKVPKKYIIKIVTKGLRAASAPDFMIKHVTSIFLDQLLEETECKELSGHTIAIATQNPDDTVLFSLTVDVTPEKIIDLLKNSTLTQELPKMLEDMNTHWFRMVIYCWSATKETRLCIGAHKRTS